MSECIGLCYGLFGLIVIVLLVVLVYFVVCFFQILVVVYVVVVEENQLQLLKDVVKQVLVYCKLDIQEWKIVEGVKVLFVEVYELLMFDLCLIFVVGSSQDVGIFGLLMLINVMFNEGVLGKDIIVIVVGFEDFGVLFSNGFYCDMVVVGLCSLFDVDKWIQVLKLFEQVIGQLIFFEDVLVCIKNQVLVGFEYQKQNFGKLVGLELFKCFYGEYFYVYFSDGDEKFVLMISCE